MKKHSSNTPAILGGDRLGPQGKIWPVPAPSAIELAGEAISTGLTCGYAGNDAPLRTLWEREAAASAGYRFGIAVTNGTHAIAVALGAQLVQLGEAWAKGRDVICGPTFTWVPGTYAGARMGVADVLDRAPRVKLFDASASDWTIDSAALVDWIRANHSRVLGVVVPSLLDTHPDLGPIVAVARHYGLPLVHDGAQNGGARWVGEGKPATATLSTQLGKFEGAATGEGGAVFTDDVELAYLMRRFTDCGGEPSGALDPLEGRKPAFDGVFPLVGNYRLSGVLGAAALGSRREMAEYLRVLRRTRRELGTEFATESGLVVFRTPPIQTGATPTYGWGMTLTPEAEAELGLDADQWRAVFAAEGFADDANGYKFGVRRPYPSADRDPKMGRYLLEPGEYPKADAIAERGLMFHLAHLLDQATPARVHATIWRTVADIARVRAHFGVASS